MKCRICQEETVNIFSGKISGKFDISYFRCPDCRFLQTEEPFWLEEAYSLAAVSELDLGSVSRSIQNAGLSEGVILTGFNANARFIDWGGGYGLFVRLMRDLGYDYYWRDLHCQNLFAKQFVAEEGDHYQLLSSFEVFEHLIEPWSEIEQMLKFSRNIFFTTLLAPVADSELPDWWYLAREHGQHVSFYSRAALEIIAQKFGLYLSTDGVSRHLLSERPLPPRRFRMVMRDRRGLQKESLLMDDFRAVTGWNV